MKRSKFSEEQIVYAIRQADAGTPVGDLCRQLGVSDATFYAWKRTYAHRGVSELRRLRQLEEENNRVTRLVADLSLDKHMRSEALRKTVEGPPAVENWPPGFTARFRSVACGPAAWRSLGGRRGIDEATRRINPPCGYAFAIWPRPVHGLGPYGFGCSGAARDGWSIINASDDGIDWRGCRGGCGSGDASISRCIVAQPRSRPVLLSAGAWISCMIPWPMGGRFVS